MKLLKNEFYQHLTKFIMTHSIMNHKYVKILSVESRGKTLGKITYTFFQNQKNQNQKNQ